MREWRWRIGAYRYLRRNRPRIGRREAWRLACLTGRGDDGPCGACDDPEGCS